VSRVIFQASLKDGRRGKSTDGNRKADNGRTPDMTGKSGGAVLINTIKDMAALPRKRLRVLPRRGSAASLWKSF
jgi:hypothetical protein